MRARHPDAEGFIERDMARPVRYRPVETDGAARAAACLSELI
jgi:hypothetical protein